MKNILLIVLDCLRADVCYGANGRAVTPIINNLVGRGTSLSRMMSVTTTTTPSFASIMTGAYPSVHGLRTLLSGSLAIKTPTLAEYLQKAGYNTAAFTTGPLFPETGLDRGFNLYEHRPGYVLIYSDWGREAIDKIKRLDGPWFTIVHLWELHDPRYIDDGFNSDKYGNTGYERALSSLDGKLGQWFSELDMDNTVVILTGDHGENYAPPRLARIRAALARMGLKKMADRRYPPGLQHGYGIYDFLVNVPFSVSGPGIAKGLKINTVASHVDIAPTILELAGAPVPEEMAGRSLLPVLSGGSLQDRPVYMEACGIVIPSEDDWLKGVRTDEWKYIYAPRNKKIEELLFNLKEDPEESINLAGKMPQVVEKMRGLLKEIDQENEQRLKAGSFEDEQTKALEDKLRSLGYM